MFRLRWVVKWGFISGVVALAAVAGTSTWRFASTIRDELFLPPGEEPAGFDDAIVQAVDGAAITLTLGDDSPRTAVRPGAFGLRWAGGAGLIGDVVAEEPGLVVRAFEHLEGTMPVPGDPVDFTTEIRPGDPEAAAGVPFREVPIAGDLGPLPAWVVEGSTTWVIVVHGHHGDRGVALRLIPPIQRLGHTMLAVSLRNDREAPADPSGFVRFGLTEWSDLDDAARYATDQGADRIVLAGYSMGASVIFEFLDRSFRADDVVALILDSPLVDLPTLVDREADEAGAPRWLTALAKQVASLRFGIRWADLDYTDVTATIELPTLIFHGTEDESIPVGVARDLAARIGEPATLVEVEGAGHIESWNVAPAEYERAVLAFLNELDLVRITPGAASDDVEE